MVNDDQPGKVIAGSGLLIMGILIVIAGLSLGFESNAIYFVLVLMGAYIITAVVDDQLIKNIQIYIHRKQCLNR